MRTRPPATPEVLAPPKPGAPPPLDARALDLDFRTSAGDRIFFSSGSAELGARARAVVAAQAEWLRQQPATRVTVEGHADDGLGDEQNARIAAERATAVRDRLVAEGVDERRIRIVVRGRTDRVAPCADASCAAHNRRAVSIVWPERGGSNLGRVDVGRGSRGSIASEPGAQGGVQR